MTMGQGSEHRVLQHPVPVWALLRQARGSPQPSRCQPAIGGPWGDLSACFPGFEGRCYQRVFSL